MEPPSPNVFGIHDISKQFWQPHPSLPPNIFNLPTHCYLTAMPYSLKVAGRTPGMVWSHSSLVPTGTSRYSRYRAWYPTIVHAPNKSVHYA